MHCASSRCWGRRASAFAVTLGCVLTAVFGLTTVFIRCCASPLCFAVPYVAWFVVEVLVEEDQGDAGVLVEGGFHWRWGLGGGCSRSVRHRGCLSESEVVV